MRALLICHEDGRLDRHVLPRWPSPFSTLRGVVILLKDSSRQTFQRMQREVHRLGLFRFFDVLAFRAYYNLFLRRKNMILMESKMVELCCRYPETDQDVPYFSPETPIMKMSDPSLSLAVRIVSLLDVSSF